MTEPNYVTHDELDSRLNAFSGHVEHLVNMNKSDTRRAIVESEQRLEAKIDAAEQRLEAKIDAVEQRLEAKIDAVEQRLEAKIDAVEQRLEAKIDAVEQRIIKYVDTRIAEVQVEVSHIKNMTLANTKMLEAVMQNLNALSENVRKLSERR